MPSADLSVGPDDESLHAASDDPLWSESFYLNFSDASGDLGGFTRVALHPKRNETEGLLCLYLPNGGVGLVLTSDALIQPNPTGVSAGALVHERVERLRQWRIRYDGAISVFDDPAQIPGALEPNAPAARTEHVTVDLDITGSHPPFFYPDYRTVKTGPPHHARAPRTVARMLKRAFRRPREIMSALNMRKGRHYEQSMVVRGSLTIAGERFPFNGTGHRDHSWGPRDWAPSERWRWLTGQMDGFAFNAMYLTIAGTHVTNGYVWHDGRCDAVEEMRLETTFDETGLAGRDIHLELTAGGERHEIRGQVLLNVPLPIVGPRFSMMYTVGRTRYQYGDRVGYGVAEFLERLDP